MSNSQQETKPFPWPFFFKAVLSIGLLAFIMMQTDLRRMGDVLRHANGGLVVLSFAAYMLAHLLCVLRWQALLQTLSHRVPLGDCFRYYMTGHYMSMFLPGVIGGDVLRLFYLQRHHGIRKRVGFLSMMMERGFGLFTLLALMVLALSAPDAAHLPDSIAPLLVGMTVSGGLIWLLLTIIPVRLPIIPAAFRDWLGMIHRSLRQPGILAAVGYSLLVNLLLVLIHMLLARALSLDVSPAYLTLTFGLTGIVSILPVSINGLGLREGGYQLLLGLAGISAANSLSFALLWLLLAMASTLPGGYFFMQTRRQQAIPGT
ncbi:MAG: lysylphosphatidylglycerol synthase transmembrane domain-containing protein [Candidatus Melainabacteria bacterium]